MLTFTIFMLYCKNETTRTLNNFSTRNIVTGVGK